MSNRADEVIAQMNGLEKKVATAMMEVIRERAPKPVLEKDLLEGVTKKLTARCTPEEMADIRRQGVITLIKMN